MSSADRARTPLLTRCAEAPTGPAHVRVARLAATSATLHADACWRELRRALETNGATEEARTELASAMAQQVYAWAVYHSTVADADAAASAAARAQPAVHRVG